MAGPLILSATAALALASVASLASIAGAAEADNAAPVQAPLASASQDTTPSAANLLNVPLVNNIPGGVTVPGVKSPAQGDPQAIARGRQYFNGFNCVGCHGTNGGGGMGPALSNQFFKYGNQPGQLYNVIAHGAPLGMPAWGTVLPDSTIWDIIAYIQSISNAPSPQWGTTVNAAEHEPAIEQVPAEFGNTSSPWQHTQPFSSGHKPTSHTPTAGEPSDWKSQ